MSQKLRVLVYSMGLVLALAAPVCAAEEGATTVGGVHFSAAFGAALTIVGAGYGISRIGQAALDGMARQPEAAGKIQTAMIIAAALIEGATFFALIVCLAK